MSERAPWERLTTVATLGTRRATASVPTEWPDPSLSESGAQIPLERAVLRAAAARRVWDLAGSRVPVVAAAEDQQPPHAAARPFASDVASMRLLRMIGGEGREFIGEWLELAQKSKSLAPQWLPIVLEGIPAHVRNAFPELLGPAAEWLSRLNPEWVVTPAVVTPSEQRWSEGTLEERRAQLAALRQRDPARAREWLLSTWQSEPPEAREVFVHTLNVGLSPDDEHFLESVLDDKRKAVRQAAVSCLAKLPESAHARRNRARLEPLVRLDEKKTGLLAKLSKRKLHIGLPAALDKAAQRDGIDLKPPAQRKIGERSFWFVQMVALATPPTWTELCDCDAGTFVNAAMDTEYAHDLLSALTEAGARFPEPEWLVALCDAWLESKQEPHVIGQAIARLVAAAPLESRDGLLEAQADKLMSRDLHAGFHLLDTIELQWTPEVTKVAIEQMAQRARKDTQRWSHARNALDSWGRRCDVRTAQALLPDVLATIGEQSPWRNALERLNETVEFRAAMRQELT